MTVEIRIDAEQLNVQLADARRKVFDNQEPILIAAASGALALVSHRIHSEGKRADGSDIGQYSNGYIRTREKYNRGGDRKVVLSLTRQMENDFTVVDAGGKVGLGFNNFTNFQKAEWMEERYPDTYNLSEEEIAAVTEVIENYINGIFA